MSKQEILPVEPLIQCEAGRQRQYKDKAFIPQGLQNGRRVIKVN